MTLLMAYLTLIAAGIGACAFLTEIIARSRGKAGRWVWVGALAFTVVATVLAMVVPRPVENTSGGVRVLVMAALDQEEVAPASAAQPGLDTTRLFEVADLVLPLLWLAASAVLLIAIVFGRRRLHFERVRAQRAQVAGHPVLVTESVGPAVAGIREPVVFIPRWVLALDDPSQRLLMAHEMEHVHRRDTALLFAGAASAAVMPWNPVVWWMVGRLRLAVEQDCDARVLAMHPGVRRYADLLLTAASRHGLTSRLLAAHFGEHTSDLLKRIEAMTNKDTLPWRRMMIGAFASVALVVAACETPRPGPVAPLGESEKPSVTQVDTVEVAKPKVESKYNVVVLSSEGKELARYAGEIPVAHLPPDGIQSIRAEERACELGECMTARITLKPGQALRYDLVEVEKLPNKIRATQPMPQKEFRIDEIKMIGAKSTMLMKDATLVPTSDKFPGEATLSGSAIEERVVSVDESLAARNEVVPDSARQTIIYRPRSWRNVNQELPNIRLLRSDRTELRFLRESDPSSQKEAFMNGLQPDDIAAIEVYKGKSCEVSQPACPLITIHLKAGREAKYEKR
jgi:beta-lactamase regulating signal transducer with metallopeptidase domain